MFSDSDMEKYEFYRLYAQDFEMAKRTIVILKRYKRKDVRFCLIRDLVTSYTRPFSSNKGVIIPKHSLPISFVPQNLRELHQELMSIRNQLFAHNDYTHKKPKVANWSTPSQKWFPMSFRGFNYNKIELRIPDIKVLVHTVSKRLSQEIENIENTLFNP